MDGDSYHWYRTLIHRQFICHCLSFQYNYDQERGTWHFRRDLTSAHEIETANVEAIDVFRQVATTGPLTHASNVIHSE